MIVAISASVFSLGAQGLHLVADHAHKGRRRKAFRWQAGGGPQGVERLQRLPKRVRFLVSHGRLHVVAGVYALTQLLHATKPRPSCVIRFCVRQSSQRGEEA